TFAPPAFLDLFALSREHPQLQDLLNVRYVLPAGSGPPPAVKAAGPLRVWPGALLRLPLASSAAARQVEIHSHLVHALPVPLGHGLEVPQGTAVATAHLMAADGPVVAVPLRAGIETAEWALDRPNARAGHRGVAVARSWSVPEGYQGHTYRATVDLPHGFRPT